MSSIIIPQRRRKLYTQRPRDFIIDPGHQLAQGLVFAGLGRFHGTTRYHDSSLYGNTGTLSGFALTGSSSNWVPGIGRVGLDFDGADDVVTLSTAAAKTITANAGTNHTVSCWLTYATGESYPRIIQATTAAVYDGFIWQIEAASGHIWFTGAIAGSSRDFEVSTDVFPTATPTHFCGVYDSGAIRTYFNGVLKGNNTTYSGLLTSTSNEAYIGNRAAGDRAIDATIYDFMFYGRALSVPEITALADPSNVMLSVGGNPLLVEPEDVGRSVHQGIVWPQPQPIAPTIITKRKGLHVPRGPFVQRPRDFIIDPGHQLAKGLVFAGLGAKPNTGKYYDSSLYNIAGTLFGSPAWTRAPELGRIGLKQTGVAQGSLHSPTTGPC